MPVFTTLLGAHEITDDDLRDLAVSLDTFFTFLASQLPSHFSAPAGATRGRAVLFPSVLRYGAWVDQYASNISHRVLRQIFHSYCFNNIMTDRTLYGMAASSDYLQRAGSDCLLVIYNALFLLSFLTSQLPHATTPTSSPGVGVPILARSAPACTPNFDTMRMDTIECMLDQATTVAVVHGDAYNSTREWISLIKRDILSRPHPALNEAMSMHIGLFMAMPA